MCKHWLAPRSKKKKMCQNPSLGKSANCDGFEKGLHLDNTKLLFSKSSDYGILAM